MLIDTHAHVNFVGYKDDGDEVVKRALENDTWIINIGSQFDTSRRAVEYAQKFGEGVFASVGLHPIHLKKQGIKENPDPWESIEFETQEEKFDYEKYKDLAKSKKVVAIGETGLDYYRLNDEGRDEAAALQKENFIEHLELAQEVAKPIIIHCRNAHNDVLEILKSTDYGLRTTARGVVHSFSGRWSQAQEYMKMGFYLAFNGIITFARDYDRVIQNMPIERLLLETDCPYLTPVPFRGKRNEPLYVKYVAQKIAELRGLSFDQVAETTTQNAKNLFNI